MGDATETVDTLCPFYRLQEAGIENVRTTHGEKRIGDVMRNFSDTTKARERLGWEATTTLPDGLRRTVAWFFAGSGTAPGSREYSWPWARL